MERTIIARHGESVFSVKGALNGDPSVPGGLTAAGVEQARRLAGLLRDAPLDLLVTSELERAIVTADEVTRDRELPRIVMPELNDPRYGPYEGAQIDDYRTWAAGASSADPPGDGGESRYAIVERYARAFRLLLARPEACLLVVAHSLPIAYALAARDGVSPSARMPFAEYATPYVFTADQLERVIDVIDRWLEAPTF